MSLFLSLYLALVCICIYWSGCNATVFPNCTHGLLAGTPICDESLPIIQRATWMVRQLNVSEKASRLQNTSPAIARVGLPAYEWWSEALHGIAGSPGVVFAPNGTFRCATSFPEPIGLAATFDRELIHSSAVTTSDEARAFNNVNRAGMDFWTPNVNLFRDPRWGRGQETPGEDTYLASEYVHYLIHGYQQGNEDDSRYYKMVAACKHYAGYDLENWEGTDRYHYNAIISNQDLVETYLPAFKACMKDAQVGAAMCSYNAVNGVPACANDFFMNEIARQRWSWQGWITSDCGAISGILDDHHYVSNHSAQVAVALRGGCDIGCDTALAQYAEAAVRDGSITEADLDRSLLRQFSSLLSLGYFDDPTHQPFRSYGEDRVHNAEGTALSLRAARESLVLLKNDGVLPLRNGSVHSVALIGPNQDNPGTQKGNYNGNECFMDTPLLSFTRSGLKVNAARGCDINSNVTTGFAAAIAAAKASDFIVYLGGLDQGAESEYPNDRTSIALLGEQTALLQQLEQVGKPLILVLWGGGGVDVSYFKTSIGTNAILWHGYPSQSGGQAMLEALFGVISPAGRLPVTWYPADYVNQVPMTDQTMRASAHNPGRTYKFYTGVPVFPFGYGESYTTWSYQTIDDDQQLLQHRHREYRIVDLIEHARVDDRMVDVAWTVNVTNTGQVVSDHIVLGFVLSNGTIEGVTPPLKELFDFTRLHDVPPGASRVITLGLNYRVLSSIDKQGHSWLLPAQYTLQLNNEVDAEIHIVLTGEPMLVEAFPGTQDEIKAPVVVSSFHPGQTMSRTGLLELHTS